MDAGNTADAPCMSEVVDRSNIEASARCLTRFCLWPQPPNARCFWPQGVGVQLADDLPGTGSKT